TLNPTAAGSVMLNPAGATFAVKSYRIVSARDGMENVRQTRIVTMIVFIGSLHFCCALFGRESWEYNGSCLGSTNKQGGILIYKLQTKARFNRGRCLAVPERVEPLGPQT